MRTDLLSLGECMVELSRQADGHFALAFGGDTFNTAAYAARLGLSTAYGTALGDDPYSQGILDLAASEGIDTAIVPRLKGRLPGLYVIETDGRGERSFFYWRDSAPARALFELAEAEAIATAMHGARCVYFSGITLSLYTSAGLDRMEAALRGARQAGAIIAFDGNFRPRGWAGDYVRARMAFARFLRHVDIALPTFDDEQALWGDADAEATLARLDGLGVAEIAIKQGPDSAILVHDGRRIAVPVPTHVEPIDTTAAGDSFNAGYLAGRLKGMPPPDAALLGHRMAGIVIRHRGAIVPKDATRDLASQSL